MNTKDNQDVSVCDKQEKMWCAFCLLVGVNLFHLHARTRIGNQQMRARKKYNLNFVNDIRTILWELWVHKVPQLHFSQKRYHLMAGECVFDSLSSWRLRPDFAVLVMMLKVHLWLWVPQPFLCFSRKTILQVLVEEYLIQWYFIPILRAELNKQVSG